MRMTQKIGLAILVAIASLVMLETLLWNYDPALQNLSHTFACYKT